MGDRADEPFQLVIANDLEFREAYKIVILYLPLINESVYPNPVSSSLALVMHSRLIYAFLWVSISHKCAYFIF